ncbi:MAG TPA: [protein-PII] uridylyltransferase [Egibacteraceae bacterium]|nr:[protein-PII] uridylyltransferase [Egibacteraceae bacterium]
MRPHWQDRRRQSRGAAAGRGRADPHRRTRPGGYLTGLLDPGAVLEAPGRDWCSAWTLTVDRALTQWLGEADQSRGIAIVALGSYARGELCPGSDIDLLLLHDGWKRGDLEPLVQALCYPLWDAGLTVGHGVRTPKETVRAAGDRIDSATALADRRLVAGDAGLLDDLASRADRWLAKNSGGVLSALSGANAARHAAAGDRPGMLEPNLKDGAGGLRDLHSLRWAAVCILGEVGLDPLVGARYLGAGDRRELAQAGEALLAARCALHLVSRAADRVRARSAPADDRLRLDLQDEVGGRLGMADGDELLRSVGLATRTIAHLHGRTWPLLLADATRGRRRPRSAPVILDEGITLSEGLVEVDPQRSLAKEPSLGLRTVAAAASHGAHLGRATAARLRGELEHHDGPLPWDAEGREALLSALRRGRAAMPALADADHIGLLAAHLPDWPEVRGRPQRNPFHRFDLDTHALEATAALVEIAAGALEARHVEIWDGLADPDALLLGAFLHDMGKAWPGDHSDVGAEVAQGWMAHMGFDEDRARHVSALVRLHLLLPRVATRRDLDDDDELAEVARTVGDTELLDGLYLLSLADARATGPSAHSPWKDSLLAELHGRVRRVLTRDAAAVRAETGAAIAQARASVDPALIDALLAGLPRRYLLAASAEQLAAHARLLESAPQPGEVRASVRAGPAEGTVTVTMAAGDRRGVFADCAGVLAGHGAEVLDARAFTRADGVALDWFVAAARGAVDWAAMTADLERVGGDGLDVAALVARREGRRDERPPALAAPIPITVRFDGGRSVLRIEVHGPDAPGVLYRLGRVIAAAGLDVVGARVSTLGPEVRDVFFVRAPDAPIDTDALGERLRAAAARPSAEAAPATS